ncbi:thioesterase family protein [Mycobacterium sp. UM_CSW]|uniref:thioesterase family protein n=1 Tax=Mycobacterium sp. UM_CSW TaxID=1370119 RepID=UPI0004058ADD|nr:thioesterase family protein [Mycobacterium sp. UM_CSW]
MASPQEPYFTENGKTFVPSDVARGGWGPTVGGHAIGGLLARAVESERADETLIPARFTVDILRRVALAPVRVEASVVRSGRRMQAVDAVMTQDGELVARAATLFLRQSEQPQEIPWTPTRSMPPLPEELTALPKGVPMQIVPYNDGVEMSGQLPWQQDGLRQAWIREIRSLVGDEELTPFIRAAMAVDVTASMTGFTRTGLGFINADYTLTLCRLPKGSFVGLAGLTHHSAAGVGVGAATLFDAEGPIGTGVTTAAANTTFRGGAL